MKKIIEKYSTAIILYCVIIIGIFSLNERFKNLNEMKGENSSIVAINN